MSPVQSNVQAYVLIHEYVLVSISPQVRLHFVAFSVYSSVIFPEHQVSPSSSNSLVEESTPCRFLLFCASNFAKHIRQKDFLIGLLRRFLCTKGTSSHFLSPSRRGFHVPHLAPKIDGLAQLGAWGKVSRRTRRQTHHHQTWLKPIPAQSRKTKNHGGRQAAPKFGLQILSNLRNVPKISTPCI